MSKLTHQARKNIVHAVYHLEQNKIHIPNVSGGWYSGNKEQFIERHVASINYFRGQLSGSPCGKKIKRNKNKQKETK